MTEVVVVLTTLPADGQVDPESFAGRLVEERLAACVNVLPPMRSVYRWRGAVEQDTECLLVMKTTVARLAALEARVCELHPYELPEFVVLPVSGGSAPYLSWVEGSSTPDPDPR